MLKSPWMLLAVVPGGFLLVAAIAAFGPAQSFAAAGAFAGLAALAFVTGALFTFTFASQPAVPTLAALRRIARKWISDHPGATEGETRAALVRWFRGSTPGNALLGAGLPGLMVGLWYRFFPTAPARTEDIEAALGELRGEGVLGQG